MYGREITPFGFNFADGDFDGFKLFEALSFVKISFSEIGFCMPDTSTIKEQTIAKTANLVLYI